MRTTSAPAAASAFTWRDGRVDVARLRGRHALDGDRVAGADRDVPMRTERVGLRVMFIDQMFEHNERKITKMQKTRSSSVRDIFVSYVLMILHFFPK